MISCLKRAVRAEGAWGAVIIDYWAKTSKGQTVDPLEKHKLDLLQEMSVDPETSC